MKRIGHDLGRPDHARHHVADDEQLHRPEHQCAKAHREPDHAQALQEAGDVGVGRQQAEQARIEQQRHERQGPDRHHHVLALQVVADLDRFLVFVRGFVDVVIALRFEEEVARLPAGHGETPGQQRRQPRVLPHQRVADHEGAGGKEVQRTVHQVVVVIAVVVPALFPQLLHEGGHRSLRPNRGPRPVL